VLGGCGLVLLEFRLLFPAGFCMKNQPSGGHFLLLQIHGVKERAKYLTERSFQTPDRVEPWASHLIPIHKTSINS
jgi:hypothetical protein